MNMWDLRQTGSTTSSELCYAKHDAGQGLTPAEGLRPQQIRVLVIHSANFSCEGQSQHDTFLGPAGARGMQKETD